MLDTKPWKKDVKYFKKVTISAIALIKMLSHAIKGGSFEVMGIIQGRIKGDTFIIVNSVFFLYFVISIG